MKKPRKRAACSICGSPAKGLGYCSKHYQNYIRLGTPFCRQKNTIEIFLNKINSLPLNQEGCKIWSEGNDRDGYGFFCIDKIIYRVHRLLYITLQPGDYEGLVIRHICDTPACCNINHLTVGTTQDNTDDMVGKDRHVYGERVGTSRLSNEQAKEIRSKYPEKNTTQLAQEYNVCKQTICNIINNLTYVLS